MNTSVWDAFSTRTWIIVLGLSIAVRERYVPSVSPGLTRDLLGRMALSLPALLSPAGQVSRSTAGQVYLRQGRLLCLARKHSLGYVAVPSAVRWVVDLNQTT